MNLLIIQEAARDNRQCNSLKIINDLAIFTYVM